MTPIEIGQAVAVVVVAAIIAFDKLRERRAKKRGLPGNPARCEEHAIKLGIIETEITNIKADIKYIMGRME